MGGLLSTSSVESLQAHWEGVLSSEGMPPEPSLQGGSLFLWKDDSEERYGSSERTLGDVYLREPTRAGARVQKSLRRLQKLSKDHLPTSWGLLFWDHFEGLSQDQIAARHGCTQPAVCASLTRSKEFLTELASLVGLEHQGWNEEEILDWAVRAGARRNISRIPPLVRAYLKEHNNALAGELSGFSQSQAWIRLASLCRASEGHLLSKVIKLTGRFQHDRSPGVGVR